MAILLLLTRAVWANDYSQITTVQARIRASSIISYPPSDVLSFQLNGSLLSIIMLILKHDCVIIWSSLPSRGLCFKNYNMRVVLNRENEPLIFPLHFGSRRLKLHEIVQRKCKGEVTWSLNATYFRAAALQVKDTVTPWSIVRIVSLQVREAASWWLPHYGNEWKKMSHAHQATEINIPSYFEGFELSQSLWIQRLLLAV